MERFNNILKFILYGSEEAIVKERSLSLSRVLIWLIELMPPFGIYFIVHKSFEGMGDYALYLGIISFALIWITEALFNRFDIVFFDDIRVPMFWIPTAGAVFYWLNKKNG